MGGEDEVHQYGAVHEGECQSREDHDGVGGTKIGADKQVLLESDDPQVSDVGEGSSHAPVDKTQKHTIYCKQIDLIYYSSPSSNEGSVEFEVSKR